jgi:RNA polymerase sigma-70 factor (ECF subfamily)
LEQVLTIQTAVVKKACKGDAAARAWLYEQYAKAMFNICTRMASNRNDAEDLLQDAFIIAFNKLHQLKEAEQFGGWLKRIVVNECIRYTKKSIVLHDLEDNNVDQIAEDGIEWWKTVDMKVVHREIKNLPEGCKQVFTLYVVEDYSHKEIAFELGISESTSKSQYHRAKKLLKESINTYLAIHG